MPLRIAAPLRARTNEIKARAESDVQNAARVGQDAARRAAPVDTGRLRQSITLRRISDSESVIESTLPYAAIQERRRGFMERGADAAHAELKGKGY